MSIANDIGGVGCSADIPDRREGMILIDNMLFDQEWFVALPIRKRLLYIYLLTKTSKVGVFELNLRRITYDMNPDDGQPITEDDIFNSFGGRVVKLGESKGIFVDYIAFNWMRDKPLDPFRNPLHRGLAQELARYGLSFEKVNAMSTKKNLKWIGQEQQTLNLEMPQGDGDDDDDAMFEKFWSEYPSSCPRKVDKKKCREKFARILGDTDNKSAMFKAVMDGLATWKESYIWRKDGGNFIKAPLVWLNGACWNDNPNRNGGRNDGGNCRGNRPANYIGGTVDAKDTF